jgi:prepilin-type N-terminal cleavage/methylation domain-containing protein
MRPQQRNKQGFTIVELLIVIVVIGILAAITMVAYGTIQQRAKNTATISAVNAYDKLVKLHITGENAYPLTSSTCLQVISGVCSSRSATMDANLRKYGSLPNDQAYSDITYSYATGRTIDGDTPPAVLLLLFSLDGTNQDCGVPNVVNQTGANAYAIDTTPPMNTVASTSTPRAGMTRCFVYVPGP